MRTFAEQPKANQRDTTPKASKPDQPNSGARHDVSLPLYLQRSIGNQEAQRLLQGYAEGAPRRLGHTFSQIPVRPPKADALQTKLAINKPGDEYEQEADRVAEQIMKMPEPKLQRTLGNQAVQRLLQNNAEEGSALVNDTALQNAGHFVDFANIPVFAPSPISVQPKLKFDHPNEKYEQEIDSKEAVRGGGMDETAILQPSEPGGPQDIVLNSELPDREQVLAVTLDHTIHVSPNASRLSKPELDRIFAHESVHVAQQNLPGRPGTRSEIEHEANALAPLVLADRPFRPLIPASPATALRDELTIGTGAADQQIWVRRIDTIVRNRFLLNGVRGRMTDPGRVEFQDVETFARGFGSAQQDLLVEAFAEGFGEVVYRIKNFYNFHVAADSPEALAEIQQFVDDHRNSGFLYWNHHALDWTDFGLTGISFPSPYSSLERVPESPDMVSATLEHWVTRAEAQAAASRQPGVRYEVADGRDWPTDPQQTQLLLFHLQVPQSRVTNRISAGEILAQTYGGVTTGGARGSRRIRIRSSPAQPAQSATGSRPATPMIPARPSNVSTLVHEACHFYAHNNFNRFVDEVRSAGTIHRGPSFSMMRLAPILEEGFTEYFTRMVMQEQAGTLGTAGTGSYQAQYEAARLIIGSMTPPSAAESAYFHGNAADIRKVRDGIQYIELYPNTVRVLQELGLDEEIEALERVNAPARSTRPGSERLRPRGLRDLQER
jgi:hypothetical protein